MATGKIKRSAELLVQSWSVLKKHPSLMVFPVISGIATLTVLGFFAVPVLMSETLQGDLEQMFSQGKNDDPKDTTISHALWLLFFAAFFVCNFVTVFFNAALLGAADRAFRGQPTGIGAGIKVATSRIHLVLGWCVISCLLGILLSLLERRLPFAGRIAVRLVGAAWGIACYFVVPVLVVEGLSPMAAVRRSVEVLKTGWGEGLALAVGFTAISTAIGAVVAVLAVGAVVAGILTKSLALGLGIASIAVAIVIGWSIVASALRTIAQLALFRFASSGNAPDGFSQQALERAFAKS